MIETIEKQKVLELIKHAQFAAFEIGNQNAIVILKRLKKLISALPTHAVEPEGKKNNQIKEK